MTINLISCFLITLIGATIFYLKLDNREYFIPHIYSQPLFQANIDRVGFGLLPNRTVEIVAKTNKRSLYQTTVHTDQYGQRIIPASPLNPSEYILTLGCSFTFGLGVEDDQTYPALLQKLMPEIGLLTIAAPGYSVNNLLQALELPINKKMLNGKNIKFVIYLGIENHINRLKGKVPWISTYPNYELINGHPKYIGMLKPIVPEKNNSFSKRLGGEIDPYKTTAEDFELYIKLVHELKRVTEEKFHSQFIFLGSNFSYEQAQALKQADLSYTHLYDYLPQKCKDDWRKCFYPFENHPLPEFYPVVANLLSTKIKGK